MASDRQMARQKVRDNGRYVDMHRCEVCGKHLGEDYASDDRFCNSDGLGLVLCNKCGNKVGAMPDDEARALLRTANYR